MEFLVCNQNSLSLTLLVMALQQQALDLPLIAEKCEQDFLHNSESKNPCGKNIIGYFRRNSILLLARLLTKPSGSIMNEIRLSQNIP